MNIPLEKLANLLSEINSFVGKKVSEIIQQPATIGPSGEYIAAEIFDSS